MDPLHALPAEIVLRVIDFVDVPGTACLTRTSKEWHQFIDHTHQEVIYAASAKTDRPAESRDFKHLDQKRSFVKYYQDVSSWKELCKRTTLLRKNWSAQKPTTRESTIQVGNDPVWRFRVDFKRRFVLSTAHGGGLTVTDLDTGKLLWRLSSDDVRPYAHLEYDMERGIAVFDRFGNAVEVWKADDTERGVFRLVTVLHHDCETRGYQLSYDTLCVVSTEEQGFVYDMKADPPQMTSRISIAPEAVGHLDQNQDAVMYSMGARGYHVHAKDGGALLGKLQPSECSNFYHIQHPASEVEDMFSLSLSEQKYEQEAWPPRNPRKDRLVSLELENGPHPRDDAPLTLSDDEWGAGMLSGSYMVGVSKAGRVFMCSDWKGALQSSERFARRTAIVECASDGSTFDLGGWLSIRNNRILFEIKDRIYIMTLPDPSESALPVVGEKQLSIYAVAQNATLQLSVPVSFMAVWDDCLMFTYATLGLREHRHPHGHRNVDEEGRTRLRAFPTKAIRILSLAPELSGEDEESALRSVKEQDLRGAVDRMSRSATALEVLLLSNLS